MGNLTLAQDSNNIEQILEEFTAHVDRIHLAFTGALKIEGYSYLQSRKNKIEETESKALQTYLNEIALLLATYEQLKVILESQLTREEIQEVESSIISAITLNKLDKLKYIPEIQTVFSEKFEALETERRRIAHPGKVKKGLYIALAVTGFALSILVHLAVILFFPPILPLVIFGAALVPLIAITPVFVPAFIDKVKHNKVTGRQELLNTECDQALETQIRNNPSLELKQRFFNVAKSCFSHPLAKRKYDDALRSGNDLDSDSLETDESSTDFSSESSLLS